VIPVFQPSRFYPCPFGCYKLKAVTEIDIWKFGLAQRLQNLWLISVKKLAILTMFLAFTSNGNF